MRVLRVLRAAIARAFAVLGRRSILRAQTDHDLTAASFSWAAVLGRRSGLEIDNMRTSGVTPADPVSLSLGAVPLAVPVLTCSAPGCGIRFIATVAHRHEGLCTTCARRQEGLGGPKWGQAAPPPPTVEDLVSKRRLARRGGAR